MQYYINVTIEILKGSITTYKIFFITLALSLPLGLITALIRISRLRLLRSATDIYIWLARGTPLLLQLFFIFYGLPSIGITFDRIPAAIIAFVLNYAAYFAEIFRSGIQSIDKGQYEAGDVLGMSYFQIMKRIILPQVAGRVLPPVSNEIITLVKDTALVYVIGISELLRAAKGAVIRDFRISPFLIAGAYYLLITLVLTWVLGRLEKRYALHE